MSDDTSDTSGGGAPELGSGGPLHPEAAIPTRPEDFPAAGPNSLATIGARIVARLLDSVVLSLPLLVIISQYLDAGGDQPQLDDVPLGAYVALVAIPALYEIALLAWRGQTVGKMVFGLRVAAMADGGNPGLSAAAIRHLLPAVFFAIPYVLLNIVGLVVWLSAAWHPLRRGWHDLAAGTVVVRSR